VSVGIDGETRGEGATETRDAPTVAMEIRVFRIRRRCLGAAVAVVLAAGGGAGLLDVSPVYAAEPDGSESKELEGEDARTDHSSKTDEGGAEPESREPFDVLIVGDSFGDGLLLGLRSRLGDRNDIAFHAHAESASGLVRRDYVDWFSKIDEIGNGQSYDVALVVFGTNDVQNVRTEQGEHVQFPSDAWRQEYRSRVESFTEKVESRADSVYWVGLPVLREGSSDVRKLNEIYESEAKQNDIEFLSLWKRSSDANGEFCEHANVGHTRRRIRLDDGVHFTTYGYRYLVSPVSERLLEDLDRKSEEEDEPNG